jgi:hypothetical protein
VEKASAQGVFLLFSKGAAAAAAAPGCYFFRRYFRHARITRMTIMTFNPVLINVK